MTRRTEILSAHKYRWIARLRERRIQKLLDTQDLRTSSVDELVKLAVPQWATGVRVRPAGPKQFVVEATEWRGH